MSLHWTLIAGFLYAEIGVVILLMIPFISSRTWNSIFKSRFIRGVQSQLMYYLYVVAAILLLFFLDAVREMWKYSNIEHREGGGAHLDTQMQNHMRLFRAQRNMYISGFCGFLCLVINRLVNLLSGNAILQAEKEAALKQAESASKAAESALKSGDDGTQNKHLNDKVAKLEKELKAANSNVESMKTQSENLTKEYDRLMEEKDRLERKVSIMGDKKEE